MTELVYYMTPATSTSPMLLTRANNNGVVLPEGAVEITSDRFEELQAQQKRDAVFHIPKQTFIRRLSNVGVLAEWVRSMKIGAEESSLTPEELLRRELWNHSATVASNDTELKEFMGTMATSEQVDAAFSPF